MIKCSLRGCSNVASWRVCFVAVAPTGEEAPGVTGLCVCDEHKDKPKFEEMFPNNSDGWGKIQQGFRQKGRVAPSWAQSRLELKPLEK